MSDDWAATLAADNEKLRKLNSDYKHQIHQLRQRCESLVREMETMSVCEPNARCDYCKTKPKFIYRVGEQCICGACCAAMLSEQRQENAKLRERVEELERELESSYDPITDEQVDKLILSATENAEERSKYFREFLDWATKEVASWPEWKRNVLGNSMKAQNDTPRKPVVND